LHACAKLPFFAHVLAHVLAEMVRCRILEFQLNYNFQLVVAGLERRRRIWLRALDDRQRFQIEGLDAAGSRKVRSAQAARESHDSDATVVACLGRESLMPGQMDEKLPSPFADGIAGRIDLNRRTDVSLPEDQRDCQFRNPFAKLGGGGGNG